MYLVGLVDGGWGSTSLGRVRLTQFSPTISVPDRPLDSSEHRPSSTIEPQNSGALVLHYPRLARARLRMDLSIQWTTGR